MAELGPEEGRALCEALEGPAPTSVRLHPQRPCRWSGAEAIPWSPAGRYLTERPSFTLDPAFHAGAYYVQEASSQFLAHVLAGRRSPENGFWTFAPRRGERRRSMRRSRVATGW